MPWLYVSALKFWPVTIDEKKRDALVAQAERMSAMSPAVSTASINEMYRMAFDDRPWPSRACYGHQPVFATAASSTAATASASRVGPAAPSSTHAGGTRRSHTTPTQDNAFNA